MLTAIRPATACMAERVTQRTANAPVDLGTTASIVKKPAIRECMVWLANTTVPVWGPMWRVVIRRPASASANLDSEVSVRSSI